MSYAMQHVVLGAIPTPGMIDNEFKQMVSQVIPRVFIDPSGSSAVDLIISLASQRVATCPILRIWDHVLWSLVSLRLLKADSSV